ncbi:MAG: RdgB/HAM1 family non-canonical purine NTP pyrophosphatase [Acaryochloridaceae cyanobacterium RL_2_7]|nr:RdgB/HAM1 family non-canonical purine NTP pyrophosphatase [Acaryochloridaceae cyanobacterium RL_2_7]
MRPLVVATQNSGKLVEMKHYLADLAWHLQLMPTDLKIEETGTTFLENAILKATQTAQQTGQWAIADDSGLAVNALNGAPGIYSARYGNSDEARINRLLNELEDQQDRSAQFVCAIAISSPDQSTLIHSEGHCPGEILTARQGEGGFGYDPVFWVPECQKTYAQMSKDEKREVSHRGRAIELILPKFRLL